ncbi:MAG TPA: subclass B3 metallo-beta-lactamase [Kofleriaceae bacterium]|nr:subclass B3 metallo-beta-lactamase [Kofleriaceae bacterium]
MRLATLLLLVTSCAAPRAAAPAKPPADPFAELHGAWSAPVEPFRIAGNLYYVGAANIASYLITTPAGHILIDTGTREMAAGVRASIAKLGFDLHDVKILLSGHAHFDHVQGHAEMQRATGAQVMALGDDAIALETGTDRSPLHAEGWEPVHVDRVLKDGDTVELGGQTLRAVWAPGHTPGCTVWTTEIVDRDRPRSVAFYACMGPNAGVPLIGNLRFPDLVTQSLASFHRLQQLSPDLWLLMHPAEQLASLRAGAPPDRDGWHKALAEGEADLRARVRKEQDAVAHRR